MVLCAPPPFPLPCTHLAKEDSLPAWEGEKVIYFNSKGGRCVPVARVQRPVSAPASIGAERLPPATSARAGRRDDVVSPFVNPLEKPPSQSRLRRASSPRGRAKSRLPLWGRRCPVGTVLRRSPLPRRSVPDAPHRGAGPEPAGETVSSLQAMTERAALKKGGSQRGAARSPLE